MKKCIALLLAMTMLMSGTSVFAKTTESFAFKENLSFDAAVKEADETFDAVQKEVEIFNFLSDYAKINMAIKLMNVSKSSDFNETENENEINRLADRGKKYYDKNDPVNILTYATILLPRAYVPSINELSEDLRIVMKNAKTIELIQFKDRIENEKTQMAELKYNLVMPKKTSNIEFSDAKEESWYYDAVTEMTAMGLFNGKTEPVNGVGTFAPDDIITEAEFVAILCRMIFDGVELDGENKWYKTDHQGNKIEVPTPWYADYYKISIMNDVYLPSWKNVGVSGAQAISRGNMATLIARAIHVSRCWSDTLYDDMKKDLSAIVADYEKVSEFDEVGVKVAYHTGIMTGDDNGNINPSDTATRAEAAAVLYRLYNLLKSNDN